MFVNLMVMDWISLTTKRTNLIFMILLVSCSQIERDTKPLSLEVEPLKNIKIKEEKEFNKEFVTAPSALTSKNIFKDKAQEYGLGDIIVHRAYAVDFDKDNFTDLVILNGPYSSPIFLKFDKASNKFLKLNYSPFSILPRASFLQFADFNKDGIWDLVIGTLNVGSQLRSQGLRIYKGELGKENKLTYTLVKGAFSKNSPMPTSSITILDFDLDGHLDIFEGNWIKNEKPAFDRLWRGDGFKFKNFSGNLDKEQKYDKNYKVYVNAGPTNSSSLCDINLDGFPDILVASGNQYPNKLWINKPIENSKKDRYFVDYGLRSNFSQDNMGNRLLKDGGNTLSAICRDYNNDGIMDIFVGEMSHSYDPESKDRSSILTGKSPHKISFIRSEYIEEESPDWSHIDRNAIWFDYNNDGLSDLLVENSGMPPKTRMVFFEQERDHGLNSISKEAGIDIVNPVGTIILDINKDGKKDILTAVTDTRNSTIKKRTYLFENEVKNDSRAITIYLRGKKSNYYGIGALVELQTSSKKQIGIVNYSTSRFPGMNEEGIHFGLGKEKLKTARVTWPYHDKNSVLKRSYNLKKFKFKRNLELTFCESGKILVGKKNCL